MLGNVDVFHRRMKLLVDEAFSGVKESSKSEKQVQFVDRASSFLPAVKLIAQPNLASCTLSLLLFSRP
jgi:hypothetical protein